MCKTNVMICIIQHQLIPEKIVVENEIYSVLFHDGKHKMNENQSIVICAVMYINFVLNDDVVLITIC